MSNDNNTPLITPEQFDEYRRQILINIRTHFPRGDYRSALRDRTVPMDVLFAGGCIFGDYVRFPEQVYFGDNCVFGDYCVFGSDCAFGARCVFGYNAKFGDSCNIGDRCTVGNSSRFGWYVRIGEDSEIGQSARFFGDASVHARTTIGAAARFDGGVHLYDEVKVRGGAEFREAPTLSDGVRIGYLANFAKAPYIEGTVWLEDGEVRLSALNGEDNSGPTISMLIVTGLGWFGRTTTFFNTPKVHVRCDCFLGTLEEFRARVLADDNPRRYSNSHFPLAGDSRSLKTLQYLGMANIAALTFNPTLVQP